MSGYDDEIGWTRIDGLLSSERASSISESCEQHLASAGAVRVGDKPHAGTRRLVDLLERIPETEQIVDDLHPVIAEVLGERFELTEATYRCPQPGFGQQKLHADDVPRLEPGPNLCATAIVALTEFTPENGATRVVPGSNLRPDLQRNAAQLGTHRDEVRLLGPEGTTFVFSGHLLHSGVRNDSQAPRPALQFTFRMTGS